MLTEKDKKRLKSLFPHRYGPFLEQQLIDRGVTQNNGKSFKCQSIKLCVKGKRSNPILEEAILKIADEIESGCLLNFKDGNLIQSKEVA